MAATEISRKKPCLESILLALISLRCLMLVFSFLQSSNPNRSAIPDSTTISSDLVKLEESGGSRNCNYSDGRWIWDLNRPPIRYDSSCKEHRKCGTPEERRKCGTSKECRKNARRMLEERRVESERRWQRKIGEERGM